MNKIVYHGSSNGNIESLKAHESTHQKKCIYATDNKALALLFMSHGNRDLDTRKGIVDGKIELVERREGVLENLYNKDGYLYELDGTTFNHYDYLWAPEVISFESEIKPLNITYCPNILDALEEEEKKGNIIIYRYPNRPDGMPLDNSDLIKKYVNFEKQGLTGSISSLLRVYPEFSSYIEELGYNIGNETQKETTGKVL